MGRVTPVQPVLSSTPPLSVFPGATGPVLDEERNFYAMLYALIVAGRCQNELSLPGACGVAV